MVSFREATSNGGFPYLISISRWHTRIGPGRLLASIVWKIELRLRSFPGKETNSQKLTKPGSRLYRTELGELVNIAPGEEIQSLQSLGCPRRC